MPDSKTYWLHALTPLHVGAGFGAGYIDLPIQREKTTGWPIVPGSAVKGVVADRFGATDDIRKTDAKLRRAFGRAGDDLSQAGALVFSDARLICLPVQSVFGTFAWVTSPLALRRLARDLTATGVTNIPPFPQPAEGGAWVCRNNCVAPAAKLFLTDLDYNVTVHDSSNQWAEHLATKVFDAAWQAEFKRRFAVVTDDDFSFLATTACEVTARVKIDEKTKTVADGALWYEEALPAETILAGLVWCDGIGQAAAANADLFTSYCTSALTLQIGGKASVGRGRTRCLFS